MTEPRQWVAGADVAARIDWATLLVGPLNDTASGNTPPRPGAVSELVYDLVGSTSSSPSATSRTAAATCPGSRRRRWI
jgi:hypothetical protein